MGKIDKAEIAEGVARITGGERNRMKAVLAAIEEQFEGISLVAVDTKKDIILFGFDYIEEQEALNGDATPS